MDRKAKASAEEAQERYRLLLINSLWGGDDLVLLNLTTITNKQLPIAEAGMPKH